jgi:hypothetical protein
MKLIKEEVLSRPTLKERRHPIASLIKGVIFGYEIEKIDNETTKNCRYLDKLIDELTKCRKKVKILRAA